MDGDEPAQPADVGPEPHGGVHRTDPQDAVGRFHLLLKISSAPKAALDMTRIRPKSSSRSFSPETSKDLSCLPRATAALSLLDLAAQDLDDRHVAGSRPPHKRGPASVIAQSPETVRAATPAKLSSGTRLDL